MLLVVGPSGSGKSTLARAVAGLLPWQFPGEWQGSLRVGDVEVARGDDEGGAPFPSRGGDRLGAAIVFQDPASQLVMERVGDDVAFGLENLAWPRAAMEPRVAEALAGVALTGFEARRSNRLSGGEQQRVAIAGVLAPGPGVLVLDEPTAQLDPAGAEAVFRILRSIREGRSATIVLVEHRVSLAWQLADTVIALDEDGRPIDVGPPDEVLGRSRQRLASAGIWLPEGGGEVPGARAPSGRADPAARRVLGKDPVLDMRQVRFGFTLATPVLRLIDLEIRPGERVALVGRNGCGKTTLLRLALGLLEPGAGTVRLGGRDPRRLPPVQLARLAGSVAQDPELSFIGESVREEIEIGLEPDQVRYAHELAERLRLPLEAFADRSPYRLSGGEQRRLSLVTGLARKPALLALDEPTYGQDRRGHEALVGALIELVGEGSAILAATHDERFVRDAAYRRVELADGWIAADEALEPARNDP